MLKNFTTNIFDNLFSKQKLPSFWLINLLGWGALIAIDTLIVSPEILLNNLFVFFDNTLQWSSGFFITYGLRAVYKRYEYNKKSILSIISFILLFSFIASALLLISTESLYVLLNSINIESYLPKISTWNYISLRFSQFLPLLTTWSLLYFGIKFWIDWIIERERAEKSDLLAQSAQLQMLRYQINPHFLFNSFGSLRALIRSDQKLAEEMVSKLSDFYKYTLASNNHNEVPFIEEIEAINNYFEIEKIRFEDNLEVEIITDPLAEEYPVPCFILNPIVENAVKYGMKTSTLPLKISINAKVKDNALIVCVSNSGKWMQNEGNINMQSTNTGLSNVKQRLKFAFPGNHKFITKEEDGFVKIIIEIYRDIK